MQHVGPAFQSRMVKRNVSYLAKEDSTAEVHPYMPYKNLRSLIDMVAYPVLHSHYAICTT